MLGKVGIATETLDVGAVSAALPRCEQPATEVVMSTWTDLDGFVAAVTSERSDSRPAYLRLADALEVVIRSAVPGDRLPSEHELCSAEGVSRLTARTTLQELERRHLVRRVRGSGTYVARRVDYRVRAGMAPSWSETVRCAGGEPFHSVLGTGVVRPPAHVRAALELPPGRRVVVVSRLGTVDGAVSGVSTSWLPTDVVGRSDVGGRVVDELVGDGESLYAALRVRGWRPRRRWTRAELDTVPLEVAAALELEGRPPVWHTASLNEDETTGRAVEYAEGWNRPDVLRMVFEFGDPP